MPALEMADIFRHHGEAYRQAHAGHLGRVERHIMTAIETCRTARLGGHVERCTDCGLVRIAYNSCRNRHCPKCQGSARAAWLAERQAELLPVPYFHVVFTLPASAAEIAFQNKAAVYAILFKAAAEALTTIAADPRHLGAEIGFIGVLHTWGQNLQHHPHVHCLVPGGGLSLDDTRWASCRPGFFLPVRVLSRLFGRLFLDKLGAAFEAGKLGFFGALADPAVFVRRLAALRRIEWVVYAKRPFAGPKAVLAYLGRYTHRVAIANSRLIALVGDQVSFRWRDYRHHNKKKVMTLAADEFIRRFLLHALPDGFHRIRHYGFLANRGRAEKLAQCRALLAVTAAVAPQHRQESERPPDLAADLCPACGGHMEPIGWFPRPRPTSSSAWHDSS
ncbi:MAG TPA: IS91 family transposase [Bradyrhizobium sp.]|uniref:IS91 family transposase n=1 Tax=Bradyrhizobium sp. TaxID=376 RepID=UPI002D803E3F|nr:IS91 family transposase [Bradyrhizobium sp.]HET7886311.1 IS91 family transposase [Bradyrhizobium sp.]